MVKLNRQMLVLPLVVCLLLVPVLASPATVAHEAQHTHHKATTHSSALCSWFCGAGQGFDLIQSIFVPTITFLTILRIESVDHAGAIVSIYALSRGPPSLSF